MKKNTLFNYYLKRNTVPLKLFPIELFFIQDRSDLISSSSLKENEVIHINVKPNFINKISYSGFENNLPTSNLSMIINQEKLI